MTPERYHKLKAVIGKRQNDITVVLDNVHNPNNISAVMRTCDAVGIQEIYVLNSKTPPVKNWGRRSNAGTAYWLDVFQFEDAESLLTQLKTKYNHIWASVLKPGAGNLFNLDLTQNIAFVFGNEKEGISEKLIAASNGSFTIPQAGIIPSLNISVACAVTLYEAYRQKDIAGHFAIPKLNPSEIERLVNKWGLAPDI